MFDRIAPPLRPAESPLHRGARPALAPRWRWTPSASAPATGCSTSPAEPATSPSSPAQRGARVVGVDFAREMLRGARRRARRRGAGAGRRRAAAPARRLRHGGRLRLRAAQLRVAAADLRASWRGCWRPAGASRCIEVDRPTPRWLRARATPSTSIASCRCVGGLLSDRARLRLPAAVDGLPASDRGAARAAGEGGLPRRWRGGRCSSAPRRS